MTGCHALQTDKTDLTYILKMGGASTHSPDQNKKSLKSILS